MITIPENIPFYQKAILHWFDQFGRKTLPWQQNKTPYRVWVSEIMLQQTQVTTVIPYYERFMARFPDLASLAHAGDDEVLHMWTGLGYYSRARNLHRAAKIIFQDLAGEFPATLEELVALPGIGRSTAGAILAIAFNLPATILDGNVKRVLTRFCGVTEWPGDKKISDQLWQVAASLTPHARVADYTQAIMDLGATLCVRGKPNCAHCPLEKKCVAHALGIEKKLPQAKPKKTLPVRQVTLLILQTKQKILLEKRANAGIWGGLWSLPEIKDFAEEKKIQEHCLKHFRFTVKQIKFGEKFRHTFSHFHLDILTAFIALDAPSSKIMDHDQQLWYNLRDSQAIGLPAPVAKILRNLELCHA